MSTQKKKKKNKKDNHIFEDMEIRHLMLFFHVQFAWTNGFRPMSSDCAWNRYCWGYGTNSKAVTIEKWKGKFPVVFHFSMVTALLLVP